jgi:SAM-dependent methyltransferase
MTIDALQYAPDKTKAIAEVARILRPGRRFGFVAFELDAERVAGLPVWGDPVGDFRPLLDAAGFEVLRYEQISGWQDHVAEGFGAVAAEQEALESELGHAATAALALEASITLELRPYRGHVLVIAQLRRDQQGLRDLPQR